MVKRAACLFVYLDLMKYQYTRGSSILHPHWQMFCKEVPLLKVRSLIDQWLLSSGMLAISFLSQNALVPFRLFARRSLGDGINIPQEGLEGIRACCARAHDAKFDPSTRKDTSYNLLMAMELMRMVSCCCFRASFFPRSGMLVRCVHLVRDILAACPATPMVRPYPSCRHLHVSFHVQTDASKSTIHNHNSHISQPLLKPWCSLYHPGSGAHAAAPYPGRPAGMSFSRSF